MTTQEYKLTIGQTSEGTYWARLDTNTHYARATGEDAWTAALNAVHEAQFLLDEPPRGEGVDLAAVEALERYAANTKPITPDTRLGWFEREPDGQRMEGGRIVPTDR